MKAYCEKFKHYQQKRISKEYDFVPLREIKNVNVDGMTLPKKIDKINREIKEKSKGKIGRVLEGGAYGRSEYRLLIGDVIIRESP